MKKLTPQWVSRNKYALLLFLVISIGVALRIYAAFKGNASWDEGMVAYQAYRVFLGDVPQRDFLANYPPFLYFYLPWYKLFGYNLLSFRMVSVLCGAIIILLLYLIGRDVAGKKVGLVAALIYAISPPTIYLMMPEEPRMFIFVFMVAAVYFVQRSLRNNKIIWSFLAGFCVGIATWTLIRGAIFIVAVPVLFFIVFYLRERQFRSSLKLWIRYTVWFGLGVALFAVPFGLYLVWNTSFEWLKNVYISGGITSVGAAGKGTIFNFFFSDPINGKVAYTGVMERLFVIIPAFIFVAWAIRDFFKRQPAVVSYLLISIIGVSLFAIVIWGMGLPPCGYGTSSIGYPRISFIYLFIAATVLAMPFLQASLPSSSQSSVERERFLFIVAVWWFLTLLSSHFVNEHWLTHYFVDFDPVLALMGGFVIANLLEGRLSFANQRNVINLLGGCLVTLMLLCAGLSGLMHEGKLTGGPDFFFSPASVKDAGHFISEHSMPGDEILTNVAPVALEAKRSVFGNYDNPWLYFWPESIHNGDPMPYDPYNIVPSIEDLKEGMESGRAKFIILEPLMRDLFQKYPQLNESFSRHYYHEATFERIDVYSWQPAVWNLFDNLKNVNAYMDSEKLNFIEDAWRDTAKADVVRQVLPNTAVKVGGEIKKGQVHFVPDIHKLSGSTYIEFTLRDNPYGKIETSYALADGTEKSDGVRYKIGISIDSGTTYTELLSAEIHSNIWRTQTIDISKYQGQAVTFRLESNNIVTPNYDWLEITFILSTR